MKAIESILLFAFLTSITAISIDATLPALLIIGQDLNLTTPNAVQFVISIFILGMVFGELIFGPLSDSVGRKKAILIGLAVYGVGTLIAMTASSFEQMLLGRLIQGVGVAGPKIGTRALIRDKYQGAAMARIMSFIFMVIIVVPMLAPLLGQYVLVTAGWRAIFVLYLLLAIAVSIWLTFRQAETLQPKNRIPISLGTLFANATLIVRHPRVMLYTLSAGLTFGAQLLYLSLAPLIFLELYDVGNKFPIYFAIVAFGIGLASLLNSQLVTRLGMYRLTTSALAIMAMLAVAFLAVTSGYGGRPPFLIFMVMSFLLFCCIGIMFGNINAMAMQSLGRVVGIGSSIISSISSLIGFLTAALLGLSYAQSTAPIAIAFLIAGIGSIVMVQIAQRSHAKPV